MSVRTRLAMVLGSVLVPLLLLLGYVIAVTIPQRLNEEAHEHLTMAANAVRALQMQSCLGAGDSARVMALGLARGEPPESALDDGLARRAGYALITRDGQVVAKSANLPTGLDLDSSAMSSCSSSEPSATVAGSDGATAGSGGGGLSTDVPAVQDSVTVSTSDGTITAVVAVVIDEPRLFAWWTGLGGEEYLELTVACPGGATSSTATSDRGRHLSSAAADLLAEPEATKAARAAQVKGEVELAEPGPGHPCAVLASTPLVAGLPGTAWTWGILSLIGLLGVMVVWWLARQLTQPVIAVTDAAERVAEGDLDVRIPAERRDELGRLAASFNHMAAQLDQRLSEVQHSRDLLSENLRRLGDALQRTHDLDGLLATVCAISASVTGSTRATAWLLEGNSLVGRVSWPPDSMRSRPGRVPKEGSLPGRVVSQAGAVWLPEGDPAAAVTGPSLGAPLQRGDTVLGALVVERGPGAPAYEQEDATTLVSIAGPAGIAMDNALLHRQAQRMSVIDPLTGVGNLRMLTGTLAAEVERARHFDRNVALLIVDLDHFRELNDTHGHAAGDAVLGAVAQRLQASVRRVDRVARYGGEEFAVVCPELDTRGGMRLAQDLWQAIRDRPFDVAGVSIAVRVSIGVASWPAQARTSTELLRAADAAMVQAKRLGRDRVAQAAGAAR